MEDQTSFLLDWSYLCRGKSSEELAESLLITTLELESARFKAQEELKLKDHELLHIKHLLNVAIEEKNEAQNRYRTLLLYHQKNHRQTTTPPPVSSVEDEHITNGGFSSSDCEESIVSSPVIEKGCCRSPEEEFGLPVKALPEKGKLLEAVIKAGPLLQNLLLAGPLPQWRHPPPPVETYQVPVTLPPPPPIQRLVWKFSTKRGFPEGSDSSTEAKHQRVRIN